MTQWNCYANPTTCCGSWSFTGSISLYYMNERVRHHTPQYSSSSSPAWVLVTAAAAITMAEDDRATGEVEVAAVTLAWATALTWATAATTTTLAWATTTTATTTTMAWVTTTTATTTALARATTTTRVWATQAPTCGTAALDEALLQLWHHWRGQRWPRHAARRHWTEDRRCPWHRWH